MRDPFVVVGGDAAGLSAASKCKREDPDREVIVFEKGQWVSYAHCGMPYFVKGEVDTLDELLSLSPEEIDERGIDLRRGHEVLEVDTEAETIAVDGPDGRFEQPYGDLLIATGAHAVTSPIEGHDLDGVHTMHGLDSAAAVRAHLLDPDEDALADMGGEDFVDRDLVERYGRMDPPETVAIVGGGYVGVEMAEAFVAQDLDVHLFQRGGHLVPPFGESVADVVESELREQGVTLHLGEEVERLAGSEQVDRLVCKSGDALDLDCALVGIGIRPNTGIVEGTPIELGESGAIAVDDYGRTSVAGVCAAGDVAEMRHAVTGEPDWVPLGLTANRAGRAIGQSVAGDSEPVGDIAGTAVLKAFDQECGRTGIVDEKRAREAGFDPVTETITSRSRSGYYPGAAETTVTLVADRDSGRLLGGTIVGTDRAAIRIDILAMALEEDATVADLERADLAYAPPFAPVWDPVLTAAKVLRGQL
ncbi:FAD-dependent oxidoreductase [Halapricum salinum]|uniref:Pyridine nucleotide-disulfide oxidoreductase n=1 Tax=Halapricum salinum TaxID=1457250 RepID=A0A4D6HBQ4_9EURY|nr:FAD-dependent oxidoreductase [Halapricum salinum]QCC51379.1 pyridine nucleotide-disulfide oxidoreductase [Halapricum salinum]